MLEDRVGRRFSLELPMKLHMEKSRLAIEGVTSDLSAVGLRFTAATALEVGSEVEFEIPLPTEVSGDNAVVIHGLGRVVRKDGPEEADPGHHGIACVIDSYEFVRIKNPGTKAEQHA